ncbi:Pentapeptide repeat-containing protein [Sulfidibacter corallicola]|uniref:Pentapeptide repeat-containing protein n=1 Tax=Sulfidibacter corallicola TaxID=2818388 RepID=A0A8A4TRJ0_SULCO|nr:pentapeptide repeat-containing protein [Sulfidibacter corallicola]QTD52017.1 pentapeptide repeat-containing protein [Sulfidibacter corallicola]
MSIPANVSPCPYVHRVVLQTEDARQVITLPCDRLNTNGDVYCVFHSENVGEKAAAFRREFAGFFEDDTSGRTIAVDNFTGFVFPEMDFTEVRFTDMVDFRDAVFTGPVNFRRCQFEKGAQMTGCRFYDRADFSRAHFGGKTSFANAHFDDETVFDHTVFEEPTLFSSVHFAGPALFFGAEFKADCYFDSGSFQHAAGFNEAAFSGNASFRKADFKGSATFRGVRMRAPGNFEAARFRQGLHCEGANTRFMASSPEQKRGDIMGFDFSESVLDGANFGGIRELVNYNFRHAKLLGVSFSGTRLVNCDFTGAVLSCVEGFFAEVDQATLNRTRYVYTDFAVEAVRVDGQPGEILTPLPGSRFPAEGEFGKGPHFHLSLWDLFKRRNRWAFSLRVPIAIRITLIDYLNFFGEWLAAGGGLRTNLLIRGEGNTLRIEFEQDDDTQMAHLKERFREYVTGGFELGAPQLANPRMNEMDRALFLQRFHNRMRQFKTEASAAKKLMLAEFRNIQQSGALARKRRFPEAYQQVKNFSEEPARLFAHLWPTDP